MGYGIFTDAENGSFSNTKFREFLYVLLFVFMGAFATITGKMFKEIEVLAVFVAALTGLSVGGMLKSHAGKKLGNGK